MTQPIWYCPCSISTGLTPLRSIFFLFFLDFDVVAAVGSGALDGPG